MSDYTIKMRGYKRAQVTKLHHKVMGDISMLSIVEKNSLIGKAEQLSADLRNMNTEIGTEVWSDGRSEELLNKEFEECDDYETKIIEVLSTLKASISEAAVGGISEVGSFSVSNRLAKLKLPEVPIPYYSHHKDENLDHFLNTFEEITNKYPIGDYEKFILFKNHLKGEALILIKSLEPTQQSYICAKELLRSAFGCEVANKFDAISRLSKLKSTNYTSPYEFVGEMRTLQGMVRSLSIDMEFVLQYFFWTAMPVGLQTQLVTICNNHKPSLEEINENIFKALDRHRDLCSSSKKYKGENDPDLAVQNFAVNVPVVPTKKSQFCSLCSPKGGNKVTTHITKDCPVYSSAESKIKRLEETNSCKRCGYANHVSSECHFKFIKNCIYCKEAHMSFLCVNKTNSVSAVNSKSFKSKVGKNKTTASTAAVWSVMPVHIGSDSLLPTFCAIVNGKSIRCMKDSGCQPNFVRTDVAEALDLPIVENNFPVSVNGFNETQNYITKVVKMDMAVGCRVQSCNAICVPEIRTSLSLPGLSKCALGFIEKGYKLADPNLVDSDEVSRLDFILGMNSSHILLESQVKFGIDNESVFSRTDAGILLLGNVIIMLRNLKYLPECDYSGTISAGLANVEEFLSCMHVESHLDDGAPPSEILVSSSSISANYVVLNESNEIDSQELLKATDEILQTFDYDSSVAEGTATEVDSYVVDFVLSNTTRQGDGRLIMPLPWRDEALHLLSTNFDLASKVLDSNLSKLLKNRDKLYMIDKVFAEQLKDGIIQKVENFEECKKSKYYNFLAHMAVFKPERATTKCRVVFLSNLCQSKAGEQSLSHNQVMHPGPCLNGKISSSIMQLRFGEKVLTYDLKKAFNQIALTEEDSNKLMFLWFKDVEKGDFSPIAYRNCRLSFGLRPSPTILMLALYKILCMDNEYDDVNVVNFKKLLYGLLYMDNGAFTGTEKEVEWAYEALPAVFEPYKFQLQQFTSNVKQVQKAADDLAGEETPEKVKLLGLYWNRESDTLSAPSIALDCSANTKRKILKSIAGQFDIFYYNGPLLNRARLFLHSLQCDALVGWDDNLDSDKLHEWNKICKQANSYSVIVDRCVGGREDSYEVDIFTDASKTSYAAVAYLRNLNTNKVSFLTGKNRLINKQMELKTIPTLELQAITLGIQLYGELREELCSDKCVIPINIERCKLYSDSLIALHWIQAYTYKFAKMQKLAVFVMNRLEYIQRQCINNPITFEFVATEVNPADCLTRCLSYKMLMKSNYLTGPEFLTKELESPIFSIIVPNPLINTQVVMSVDASERCEPPGERTVGEHLVDPGSYSSFDKIVRIHGLIFKFLYKLKQKINVIQSSEKEPNFTTSAFKALIAREQKLNFPDVYDFCKLPTKVRKDIPKIMTKMNIFLDESDDMLKVRCKFNRFRDDFKFPILLAKNSIITPLIVNDYHCKLSHAGVYNLISHLRKSFWIENVFSTVKKIVQKCVTCRRFNGRVVKLNQNSYRDFRAKPPTIPFRFLFLDYIGPFKVRILGRTIKIWLLILTCLWSRAINLKVCQDLSVSRFLKALQSHVYEEGLPSKIFSDLGSQLTAASSQIVKYLNDACIKSYFSDNSIDQVEFNHYFKGNSSLGSLVEVCVKFVKRIIQSSIRNNVLALDDFELLIAKTKYLVNSRPVAFKESLRDFKGEELPTIITPEMLTKGRETNGINIIPGLQNGREDEADWKNETNCDDKIVKEFSQYGKVSGSLIEMYNLEFVNNLVDQAVNKSDRYRPVGHVKLQVGDIILLKEQHVKANQYPMAIVREVKENMLGEVTDIVAYKGSTKELVRRHVSSVVPLLQNVCSENNTLEVRTTTNNPSFNKSRPLRKAAKLSREKTKEILYNS